MNFPWNKRQAKVIPLQIRFDAKFVQLHKTAKAVSIEVRNNL